MQRASKKSAASSNVVAAATEPSKAKDVVAQGSNWVDGGLGDGYCTTLAPTPTPTPTESQTHPGRARKKACPSTVLVSVIQRRAGAHNAPPTHTTHNPPTHIHTHTHPNPPTLGPSWCPSSSSSRRCLCRCWHT